MKCWLWVCCLLPLAACGIDGEPALPESALVLDPEVAVAYREYGNTMAVSRSPLLLPDGQQIDNCAEYLSINPALRYDEDVQSQAEASEYLICDTVKAIRQTLPPQEAISLAPSAGQLIHKRLDLGSYPSSYGPRIKGGSGTLAQLEREAQIRQRSVTVDSDEWRYRVELVAIGELNGNSAADWLVWIVDESKVGSYRNYQLVVVYDVSESEGLLQASPWLGTIKSQ